MPIRIYEIARKLGLENNVVITKAKELGIAAATVTSSSLDRITAEYLEQQILDGDPALKARMARQPHQKVISAVQVAPVPAAAIASVLAPITRQMPPPPKLQSQPVPAPWEKWCESGNHGVERKKGAVLKCLTSGAVRGYYSDIPLQPDLDHDHSMYPSLEHLEGPENQQAVAVEARIINHMKAHLSEAEFWQVVEHLFIVGVQKQKIVPPFGKHLPTKWSPVKHYAKLVKTVKSTVVPPAQAMTPQVPKSPTSKKPSLDLEGILIRLHKLKPAKRATAVNAIKTMFQYTAPISDLSANRLLNALVRRGALTIDAKGKISYATAAS